MMNLSTSTSTSSSCCLNKATCLGFGPRNSLKMGGFYDKGQVDYYRSSVRVKIRCGSEGKVKVEEKVEKKKKKREAKLLKGLSRDLSAFYEMGFGLNAQYSQEDEENHDSVAHQFKLKHMSEAAELLLEQLKVKAEDKELKKKIKMEEKKKRKAEQKLRVSVSCLEESSSSSSSSESSDSESDNEMVVDLNSLKRDLRVPPLESDCTMVELPVVIPSIPALQEDGDLSMTPTEAAEEGGVISRLSSRLNQDKNRVGAELEGMVGKKIEVCMGGKCKKSGAATLIEEFQRAVGFNDDIVVSGCKCMGKCKNGPNVRVVNTPSYAATSARAPGNPLCLAVGVEDVGLIVSNFFGDESHLEIVSIPAGAM